MFLPAIFVSQGEFRKGRVWGLTSWTEVGEFRAKVWIYLGDLACVRVGGGGLAALQGEQTESY